MNKLQNPQKVYTLFKSDLDVSSKSVFEFMMKTLKEGEFRFASLHEWITSHLVPLPPSA